MLHTVFSTILPFYFIELETFSSCLVLFGNLYFRVINIKYFGSLLIYGNKIFILKPKIYLQQDVSLVQRVTRNENFTKSKFCISKRSINSFLKFNILIKNKLLFNLILEKVFQDEI